MTAELARTITGRLVFLKDDGPEWGRESFSVTTHSHGRTYRSCMEMDDFGIFRDANWSMSFDWKPLEGFSRETVDGETAAHSWYRVDGKAADFETHSKTAGRSSKRITANREIDHLGLHVILSDCMVSAARGCTEPGVERPATCLANSSDGYGRGTAEALIVEPLVTYFGTEPITVVAGAFEAEHFRVRWSDAVPAWSDFWVLREHFLPLRLKGASGPVSYELAELRLD